MRRTIASFILEQMGGIDPLPEKQVSSPTLTQERVNIFFRNKIRELFPEIDPNLLYEYTSNDEFYGARELCKLSFCLDGWTSTDQSFEEYMSSQFNNRTSFIHSPLGDNSRIAFISLLQGEKIDNNCEYKGHLSENDLISIAKETKYRTCAHQIKKATKEARNSRKVLKTFIQECQCGWPICRMSEDIQMDKDMAKLVLQNDPSDICYLRPEMMDDVDVMEEIIKHPTGFNCIRYASARVKNDKRIAWLGLHYRDGVKLEFACFGDSIRDDDKLFLCAYLNDPNNFKYASKRLRQKYFFLKNI